MKGWLSGWKGTGVLTLLFVGIYVGARNMPDAQCQFLHFEMQPVGVDGEEEMCSTAPLPFIDLRRKKFPVQLRKTDLRQVEEGAYEITFELLGPSGARILPHEIAVTHARQVHLLLIDDSLESYHHVHPEPYGTSGLFKVEVQPRATSYRYFAEFVPHRSRQLAIADGEFEFSTANTDSPERPSPEVEVTLRGLDQPLRRNRDHRIFLDLKTLQPGETLPLEMTMNAFAHLVGFEDSLSGYAHMHPQTVDPKISESAELEFVFHPTLAGRHRIWVQFRIDGEDIFKPFDLEVI